MSKITDSNIFYLNEVFNLLQSIVDSEVKNENYRKIFSLSLDTGYKKIREKSEEYGFFQSVDYPIMSYQALGGDPESAIPLAASCTLLHMSADMLDDIGDNDVPDAYHQTNPNHLLMVATELLSYLSPKTLGVLLMNGIAEPMQILKINDVFSRGIHVMSDGQFSDMSYRIENTKMDDLIQHVLLKKTGGQHEIFSASGSILGGATDLQFNKFALFGRKMGVAGQVINDLQDIWQKTISPDLINASATSVILHTYQHTSEQRLFLELLYSLKNEYDLKTVDQIKDLMIRSGVIEFACNVIKEYTNEAFQELESEIGKNIKYFDSVHYFFSRYFEHIPLIKDKLLSNS